MKRGHQGKLVENGQRMNETLNVKLSEQNREVLRRACPHPIKISQRGLVRVAAFHLAPEDLHRVKGDRHLGIRHLKSIPSNPSQEHLAFTSDPLEFPMFTS